MKKVFLRSQFVADEYAFLFFVVKSRGLEVLLLFPEESNMDRVLPKYLSQWTTQKVKGEGVQVLPNAQVQSAALEDGKVVLTLQNGQQVT